MNFELIIWYDQIESKTSDAFSPTENSEEMVDALRADDRTWSSIGLAEVDDVELPRGNGNRCHLRRRSKCPMQWSWRCLNMAAKWTGGQFKWPSLDHGSHAALHLEVGWPSWLMAQLNRRLDTKIDIQTGRQADRHPMSNFLSICVCVSLSVSLYLCRCLSLCVCAPLRRSICLSICRLIYVSFSLSLCLSVLFLTSVSICLFVSNGTCDLCPSLCPSLSLPLSLHLSLSLSFSRSSCSALALKIIHKLGLN